jgi:fumarate hydratase subunit alpha
LSSKPCLLNFLIAILFFLIGIEAVNSLGIGCMGLGGDTTALAVRAKTAHCHTASLPVAVNIQCWANRHASIVFREEE